jgi:hypothetical protein
VLDYKQGKFIESINVTDPNPSSVQNFSLSLCIYHNEKSSWVLFIGNPKFSMVLPGVFEDKSITNTLNLQVQVSITGKIHLLSGEIYERFSDSRVNRNHSSGLHNSIDAYFKKDLITLGTGHV